MGKFLKILRYIANLIATMGNELSNTETTSAAIGINHTDLSPEEHVWDEINAGVDLKDSSQYKNKDTVIDKLFPNGIPSNMSPCFFGSGRIPPSFPEGTGTLYRVYFENQILSPEVSIRRAKNGFIILVNGRVFLLPNFILFLKGGEGISTGDFLDGIAAEEPNHFKLIWEILNSSRKYKATYYTSLFGNPLRRLKTERNGMTGDIVCWSVGQFTPKLVYDGREHYISNVLFRTNMITIAKITFPSLAWNIFFKRDPILHIGGHDYPLPNYISVLSGVITEEQFIQELHRRYPDSDVEKIWNVLTDRKVLYCSTY